VKDRLRILVRTVLIFCSLSANLLAQTTASDELKLGVQAYKNSKFEEAIQHFEKCVALDPQNGKARLYLATAYAQQYIPGVDTPDNKHYAEQAIEQYQQVLDGIPDVDEPLHSARADSAKGIAYLYLQMKKFDDAKKYYLMVSDLDPQDPEPYYSIGVIDWTLTYVPRQEARAKLGMKPGGSLPARDHGACVEIREKNSANVQEGIDNLNKALKLRPDYDDAMAYMNLMFRERADIQCDDPAARDADLKTADEWVDKTMGTKKAKAKEAAPSTDPAATNPQ
jgi:tetratricopeptide (TPR) repeat protein